MYYPEGITPIHEVTDWGKVRVMARAVEAGEQLPPILLLGGMLLTGTHRWVTNTLLERRKRTDARIGTMQMRTLPEEVQLLLLEFYIQPDRVMVQEIFEEFLYSEGLRYAGWCSEPERKRPERENVH